MGIQVYKTMNDVIALAEFAHRNQTDRAGLPYIEHPRRVMESVRAQGAFPYVQMAAVLHDVTEDTAFTPDMLVSLGVPEAAVWIVTLLDRDHSAAKYDELVRKGIDPGRSRDEFYYAAIKANAEARQVKLADIADNLQPWRLSYLKEEKQKQLKAKYAKAHELLGA